MLDKLRGASGCQAIKQNQDELNGFILNAVQHTPEFPWLEHPIPPEANPGPRDGERPYEGSGTARGTDPVDETVRQMVRSLIGRFNPA